jgi:dehydrogenase/reductase SDR family protein 7B
MATDLKNKTVIITGASSGIGKSLAFAFAKEGARLVLFARSADKLSEVASSLEKMGVQVLRVVGDVSREEDCRRLVDQALEKFGAIDVLINNAGQSMRALFETADLQVIRQLMDINFWGTVYCTKFALPELIKSKGSLVGISSIAGKKGLPGRTGYSASKFAMEGFLETIRTENLKKELHVLVACPGFTASNIRANALSGKGTVQGESPRDEQSMMSSDEVAQRILRAVKRRQRDVVMTTDGKLAVWLNRLFPTWSDRLVYNHMAKEPDAPFSR